VEDEEIHEFFLEYEEILSAIAGTSHEYIPQHLRRWFAAIDSSPAYVSRRVAWLEALGVWSESKALIIKQGGSWAGSGRLNWPEDQAQRLSAQLSMFREIAKEKIDLFQFTHEFFHVPNGSIDDTVREFMRNIFDPFSAELRRYLRRNLDKPLLEPAEIPASDRVVALDHNSREYRETLDALDTAERSIAESNSLPADLKEQSLAEVGALRILWKVAKVSLHVLGSLISSTLTTFAKKFRETAFGKAATYLIDKIIEHWPAIIAFISGYVL
jgi:hypothetical protein